MRKPGEKTVEYIRETNSSWAKHTNAIIGIFDGTLWRNTTIQKLGNNIPDGFYDNVLNRVSKSF